MWVENFDTTPRRHHRSSQRFNSRPTPTSGGGNLNLDFAMTPAKTLPVGNIDHHMDTLQEYDEFYRVFRLFGLTERPSTIVQQRVSCGFRLYCILLAFLSVFFSLQNTVFVLFPRYCWQPILSGIDSTPQRTVYPMWCMMCTVLRISVAYVTLSQSFAKELHKSYSVLCSDSCLLDNLSPSQQRIRLTSTLSNCSVVLMYICNTAMYLRFSTKSLLEDIMDPLFYWYMLESWILLTAWIGSYNLIALTSCKLTKLFRVVEQDVNRCGFIEDDDDCLKVAIERHNLCWNLTDAYNVVFRNVIGATFVVSVPIFSVVTTQVIKTYFEAWSDRKSHSLVIFLMFWVSTCVLFTWIVCAYASAINDAAKAPRKRLLEISRGHNLGVLHFIMRLDNYQIGFSFFNFFVVQRTTILSVLSLMVTYLIVFLQMAQANTTSRLGATTTGSSIVNAVNNPSR